MGSVTFRAVEFLQGSYWQVGKEFRLSFTAEGNFELRTNTGTLLWETRTSGDMLAMQADGNLVIYNRKREAIWSTDTAGNQDAVFAAGEDGTLRICSTDENQVFWSSVAQMDPTPSAGVAQRPGRP